MSAGHVRKMKVLPKISDEAWEAHCAAEDEALVRSTGKHGVKFIGRSAERNELWAQVVDALAERDYIARADQTEAARSTWIKNVRCPACGSSSFFARRDKAGKFAAETVRYQCAHKCGKAILTALDIERDYSKPDPGTMPVPTRVAGSPEERIHSGHARMSYRLARSYADELMFVHGIGWHVWDQRRWIEDERGAAKRAVLDILRAALGESLGDKDLRKDIQKCETATGVAGVLNLASALEPFAFTLADLDADPYLINTAAGTLDLRTMEIRDPEPGDRITKVTIGAYRPGLVGDQWEKFLARVLHDEPVLRFLQRVAGVGLLGLVTEHIMAILTGTGANGKGVFYGALDHALGDYATTVEPDLFMHREGAHPTGEMDLRGIRWAVVSESDPGRRLAEATVKRLTGGDQIRARRMRQDFVTFTPSHTAVLVTNHLPKVSGDDPALWRRMRVIPFNVVIPEDERDVHLPERLQLEADAVLTWAVEGYRDQVDRGGLDEPESVKVATDAYQRDSDAVARFVDECCILKPHMSVTTATAHARWQDWASMDGAEPMSRKAFGQALDRHGFPADPSRRRLRFGLTLAGIDEGDDE